MHERLSSVFFLFPSSLLACVHLMHNAKHKTSDPCLISAKSRPQKFPPHHITARQSPDFVSQRERVALANVTCHMPTFRVRRLKLICEADVFLESVPMHLSQGQLLPGGDTHKHSQTHGDMGSRIHRCRP